jgi:hypothetical protein
LQRKNHVNLRTGEKITQENQPQFMNHESKSPVQLIFGAIVVLCAANCFAMDTSTSGVTPFLSSRALRPLRELLLPDFNS